MQTFNDSPRDLGEVGRLDRVRFSMGCVWLPPWVHLAATANVLRAS